MENREECVKRCDEDDVRVCVCVKHVLQHFIKYFA